MTTVTYDVVLATDCRHPIGAAALAEEIRAQHLAGYRTGIVHVPSALVSGPAPFAPAIRTCLDTGRAALIMPGDDVRTRLLVARTPAAFATLPDGLPRVRADHALVVGDTGPATSDEARYDPDRVHGNLIRLAGTGVTWAPTGPHIREALAAFGAGPLHPIDWEPLIDPSPWHVERIGTLGEHPVVGTAHGHAHDASEADDVTWSTLPAGAGMAPQALAGVDFCLVTEDNGADALWTVLACLASGAVPIAPRTVEPLFGNACLYGSLDEVRHEVLTLHQDGEAFAARSRAGVELVHKRFGPEAHIDRVAEIVGEPEQQSPAAATPAVHTARGTVVVDLTRGGDRLDNLVSSIVRATVAERGPRVVALPAGRAGELGARAAVETFPRALDEVSAESRRRYLRMRLTGIAQAHRPARVIVVDDGHLSARDALAGLDRTLIDVWHVQPVGTSDPDGDELADRLGTVLPDGWGVARMRPAAATAARPAPAKPDDAVGTAGGRIANVASTAVDTIRRALIRWLGGADPQPARDDSAAHRPVLSAASATPDGERLPAALPVTLVVVTDAYADPVAGVRALATRQTVAGTFQPALLAPPDWEAAAATAGITAETLLPESVWTTQYGDEGWPGYVRQRVREACEAIGPATVVFGAGLTDETVLDVAETAYGRVTE